MRGPSIRPRSVSLERPFSRGRPAHRPTTHPRSRVVPLETKGWGSPGPVTPQFEGHSPPPAPGPTSRPRVPGFLDRSPASRTDLPIFLGSTRNEGVQFVPRFASIPTGPPSSAPDPRVPGSGLARASCHPVGRRGTIVLRRTVQVEPSRVDRRRLRWTGGSPAHLPNDPAGTTRAPFPDPRIDVRPPGRHPSIPSICRHRRRSIPLPDPFVSGGDPPTRTTSGRLLVRPYHVPYTSARGNGRDAGLWPQIRPPSPERRTSNRIPDTTYV